MTSQDVNIKQTKNTAKNTVLLQFLRILGQWEKNN